MYNIYTWPYIVKYILYVMLNKLVFGRSRSRWNGTLVCIDHKSSLIVLGASAFSSLLGGLSSFLLSLPFGIYSTLPCFMLCFYLSLFDLIMAYWGDMWNAPLSEWNARVNMSKLPTFAKFLLFIIKIWEFSNVGETLPSEQPNFQ